MSTAAAGKLDVSKYYTQARPDATKDYVMQQTMIRCKDPAKSLAFYCDALGFNLVMHREFPQWECACDEPREPTHLCAAMRSGLARACHRSQSTFILLLRSTRRRSRRTRMRSGTCA
jgi:hypothetical protein